MEKEQCLSDLQEFKKSADYIEFFCSPSIQGAKLSEQGRRPFAQWLFALHISVEYSDDAPELISLNPNANPWKILHTQDETSETYLHRHDSRFNAMKVTGQWALQHLWYECFVAADLLVTNLDELLVSLPLYYATVLQLVPIANLQPKGFMMLPDAEDIFAIMILNPGLPQAFVPGCKDTIQALDAQFLSQGGKRYLSGFLGDTITMDYWKSHFNSHYDEWEKLKKQYDPKMIFRSLLHGT